MVSAETARQEPMKEATAWEPGLQSEIPTALWPLVTLFRDENAFVSYKDALELADLTGLNVIELISLRPERLVMHCLLVRVTADLSVQDGPSYEELGINLRGMVDTLYAKHMLPEIDSITAMLEDERKLAYALVDEQLTTHFAVRPDVAPEAESKRSLVARLFTGATRAKSEISPITLDEVSVLEVWKKELEQTTNRLHRACLSALIKTVSSIVGHRGRMLPDHSLVAKIVVNQVCNTHGHDVIDHGIEVLWQQAIKAEGYRLLPVQAKPVIMNVKGASASGKSTIRPQQRQLSEKLGIAWDDFALISPDYWRKYLLDYNSLGEDYKFAAMLTGRELEIIDKKLDRYMSAKASKKKMSHLLIDRFRFDSFIVDVDRPADTRLLSRFGDRVYLFFMVTHPAETVSRAWERGKKTGRYKAVDDLLFHNVEAFTGMPALFLSWVNSKDKRIHFEFLDNDVPKGQLPRTVALGWNQTLVILDVQFLLNIDRYRKVDIAAKQPENIFTQSDIEPGNNTEFIMRCAKTVNNIIFADHATADEYAVLSDGKLVWWDAHYIEQHRHVEGLVDVLSVLGYSGEACQAPSSEYKHQLDLVTEQRLTVGRWH